MDKRNLDRYYFVNRENCANSSLNINKKNVIHLYFSIKYRNQIRISIFLGVKSTDQLTTI